MALAILRGPINYYYYFTLLLLRCAIVVYVVNVNIVYQCPPEQFDRFLSKATDWFKFLYGTNRVCRRRRYRVASEGRSVAHRWPRLVARLHRSAGGIPLSFRTWSIHLSQGRPGRRFHWLLGGRTRDRSTWQWRALCAGTSCCSLATIGNKVIS